MRPMKAENKTIQKCYGNIAPEYDWAEGYMLNAIGLQRWRKTLLSGLEGHVLEVGAGTGLSFRAYPKGVQLTAIDLTPAMLKIAHKRAVKIGANIACADTLNLPFADNTFDAVVDCLCLCTYQNPQQALAEMRRVLKPHGQLVLLEHGLAHAKWLQKFQHKYAEKHFKSMCCRWHLDMQRVVAAADGFEITTQQRRLWGLVYLFKLTKVG